VYQSIRIDDELLAIVDGRFDGTWAPRAYTDLIDSINGGVHRIVVDLCEATEVDEGAVAVLAAAAVAALGQGGRLFLALTPGDLVEIRDPAGVRTVFDA